MNEIGEDVDYLGDVILGLLDVLTGVAIAVTRQLLGSAQLGQGSKSLLFGTIMQFLRQAIAFLEDRDLPGPFKLLAVFNGKRGPLHQRGEQPLAILVKRTRRRGADTQDSKDRVLHLDRNVKNGPRTFR